jgi:hypothetical protein
MSAATLFYYQFFVASSVSLIVLFTTDREVRADSRLLLRFFIANIFAASSVSLIILFFPSERDRSERADAGYYGNVRAGSRLLLRA